MTEPRFITAADITPLRGARVSPVWEAECQLGEGPHWDRDSNRLLFLDILGGTLFSLSVSNPEDRRRWSAPDLLSSLVQDTSGDLFGTTRHGLVKVSLQSADSDTLIYEDLFPCGADAPGNRFNDGKVGPFGTYWAGTMDHEETGEALGSQHRFTRTGRRFTVMSNMLVPNGPAFSPDGRTAWFADSARSTLFQATLDETGGILAVEPVLRFDTALGYPDGMTCDAQGHLWIAFWDGACVRRLSPDLSRIEQLDFPVARPTSLSITAGRIYVTSARVGLDDADVKKAPLSGALFAIDGSGADAGPDYRYGAS